jgi:hypothetical protein
MNDQPKQRAGFLARFSGDQIAVAVVAVALVLLVLLLVSALFR